MNTASRQCTDTMACSAFGCRIRIRNVFSRSRTGYKKCIKSNTVNEIILIMGPLLIKTSLVANIGAAYYIINNLFHITS